MTQLCTNIIFAVHILWTDLVHSESHTINIPTNFMHDGSLQFLPLKAFGYDFQFDLRPMTNKLLSNGAQFLSHLFDTEQQPIRESKLLNQCEYYHGSDINHSAAIAISHCTDRGFEGHILHRAVEAVYEITPTQLDEHRIERLDFDDEDMSGLHGIAQQQRPSPVAYSNMKGASSGTSGHIEIDINEAIEKEKRRLLEATCSEDLKDDGCHMIEMLIINGPRRVKWYQNKYGAEWKDELFHNLIKVMNKVALAYRDTEWRYEGETFLCFDVVVAAVLDLDPITGWNIPGVGNYEPLISGGMSNFEILKAYLASIERYTDDHASSGPWNFDAVHAIIDIDFQGAKGLANVNQICSKGRNCGIETTGGNNRHTDFKMATYIAHELGHNLGAWHDFMQGGGDTVCTEGDFGFTLGYTFSRLQFSACTVEQIYTSYKQGKLRCLRSRHFGKPCHEFKYIGGQCGNGILEPFEECDEDSNRCCVDCKMNPGCCPNDIEWEYQCIEITNEGDYFDQFTGEYDGYYGGCVRTNRDKPAVYTQNRAEGHPLYLKQTDRVMVDRGSNQCHGEVWTSAFGGISYSKSWIISRDDVSSADGGDIHSNSLCPSWGGNAIADGCIWRSIDCDGSSISPNVYDNAIDGFRVQKLDDITNCVEPYDYTQCIGELKWNNIPRTIHIVGSDVMTSKTKKGYEHKVHLDGEYTNYDRMCFEGMPEFQKDYLSLHYDITGLSWVIAYLGNPRIVMAECRTLNDKDWDLFSCLKGSWFVNKPHDGDEVSMVAAGQMMVDINEYTGSGIHIDITQWFQSTEGIDEINTGSEELYVRGEDPVYDLIRDMFHGDNTLNDRGQERNMIFHQYQPPPARHSSCASGYATMSMAFLLFDDCAQFEDDLWVKYNCNGNGDEMEFVFYDQTQCPKSSKMKTVSTAVHYGASDLNVHCRARDKSVRGVKVDECQFVDASLWQCNGEGPQKKNGVVIPIGRCQDVLQNPTLDVMVPEIPFLVNGDDVDGTAYGWTFTIADLDGDLLDDTGHLLAGTNYKREFVVTIYDTNECSGEIVDSLQFAEDGPIKSFDGRYTNLCFGTEFCYGDKCDQSRSQTPAAIFFASMMLLIIIMLAVVMCLIMMRTRLHHWVSNRIGEECEVRMSVKRLVTRHSQCHELELAMKLNRMESIEKGESRSARQSSMKWQNMKPFDEMASKAMEDVLCKREEVMHWSDGLHSKKWKTRRLSHHSNDVAHKGLQDEGDSDWTNDCSNDDTWSNDGSYHHQITS